MERRTVSTDTAPAVATKNDRDHSAYNSSRRYFGHHTTWYPRSYAAPGQVRT